VDFERFAAGDVNEDGVLDLVFTDFVITVLLGNGDGTFQEPAAVATEERLPWVLLRDVTADGHLDLVLAGGFGGPFGESHVVVRAGDGAGGFGEPASYFVGPSMSGLTAGDVDQDGDVDLMVSLGEVNSAAFLENDGSGTFTLPVFVGVAWRVAGGTLTEVTGDGRADLLGVYSLPVGLGGTAFLTMIRGEDLRVIVANEAAPAPSAAAPALVLSAPYPNPTRGEARFLLGVRHVQRVRVEVFDVAGRLVAVLLDGAVEPGPAQTLRLEQGALPAGVYLVRARGAHGTATQRVTLVR
jgi:hypothetical protein